MVQDDPDRPLIFICHSLGGLIVKRVRLCYLEDISSSIGVLGQHKLTMPGTHRFQR